MTGRVYVRANPLTFKISKPGFSAVSAGPENMLFDGIQGGVFRPVAKVVTDVAGNDTETIDIPRVQFSQGFYTFRSLAGNGRVAKPSYTSHTGDGLAWTEDMTIQGFRFIYHMNTTVQTWVGIFAGAADHSAGGIDLTRITIVNYCNNNIRACALLFNEFGS